MSLWSRGKSVIREWAWGGYLDEAAPYFSPGQLDGAHLPRAPAALHILKSPAVVSKDAGHL